MSKKFADYLFEYPYQGSRWGFEIRAISEADAKDRLKAMAWAKYQGELYETIPVSFPRAPFVQLMVWWRNWCAAR